MLRDWDYRCVKKEMVRWNREKVIILKDPLSASMYQKVTVRRRR